MPIVVNDIIKVFGECEILDERGIWVKHYESGKGFKADLEIGERAQDRILAVIKKKYPKAFCKKGYHKEWDIMIPENDKTIEVKQDKMSNDTGNLVIEIEMPPGTPSALSTTTATYWVFDDGYEYIWCTPEDLKKLVGNKRYSPVKFTGKGDTTPKIAYLIKKNKVKEIAIKISKYATEISY